MVYEVTIMLMIMVADKPKKKEIIGKIRLK